MKCSFNLICSRVLKLKDSSEKLKGNKSAVRKFQNGKEMRNGNIEKKQMMFFGQISRNFIES